MYPHAETADIVSKPQETYWPVVKASILNGDISLRDLHVICPICFDTMSADPSTYGPKDEYGNDHRAIVLACGHMIGKSCVELGALDSCPFCRASLKYSRCSHRNKGMTVPWAIKDLNSIPQELSKGGIISSLCDDCQMGAMLRLVRKQLIEADENSQTLNNLPTRTVAVSLKMGQRYSFLGDQIDFTMKAVPIETPAKIQLELDEFKREQLQIEKDGLVWFEQSVSNIELTCFAYQKSKMAEIWAIYMSLDDCDSDDDSDDSDEDDTAGENLS
ncbi:hypothetical protein HYE67_003228 [Fusarium culmorum]|uniref:RING-type domain-containing protein n=1 Tax=Fusarium culmorum TaxID=5516 RepID=A0A2T4GNJ4_FUSCU|nr:hypothetical protein FCULG_00000351 [Fusarium culmorum]QPC60997.1 hypothetical protein HYE67_003228 [Fusarium culmorum]